MQPTVSSSIHIPLTHIIILCEYIMCKSEYENCCVKKAPLLVIGNQAVDNSTLITVYCQAKDYSYVNSRALIYLSLTEIIEIPTPNSSLRPLHDAITDNIIESSTLSSTTNKLLSGNEQLTLIIKNFRKELTRIIKHFRTLLFSRYLQLLGLLDEHNHLHPASKVPIPFLINQNLS